MLQLISALAFATGFTPVTVDSTELRREDLMAALRSGGYTVILRHARTDRSFQEQISPVPKERNEQRNLNDDGFRDAALMGVVFRKHRISFAEIISSPMFRCTETAEMAAGKPTAVTMTLRVFPTTPEQATLVKTPPKAGTNRLIVTHHFVIETHVPTISPGEIAESEAAVIRHKADGSVELVGRITLDDWSTLANPARSVPTHGATPATAAGTNVTIPDTHAGHLAREYIAAFNSGSADKMRAYLESSMVADQNRPTEERLKSYAKLFEEHGPLSVVGVDSSTALRVMLSTKSKAGNVRLTVTSSEANPMRVASVTFTFGRGGHP